VGEGRRGNGIVMSPASSSSDPQSREFVHRIRAMRRDALPTWKENFRARQDCTRRKLRASDNADLEILSFTRTPKVICFTDYFLNKYFSNCLYIRRFKNLLLHVT